jgi:hypothetical protein
MDVQYVADSRSSEIPDEKGNPWSMVSHRIRNLLGSTGKFLMFFSKNVLFRHPALRRPAGQYS